MIIQWGSLLLWSSRSRVANLLEPPPHRLLSKRAPLELESLLIASRSGRSSGQREAEIGGSKLVAPSRCKSTATTIALQCQSASIGAARRILARVAGNKRAPRTWPSIDVGRLAVCARRSATKQIEASIMIANHDNEISSRSSPGPASAANRAHKGASDSPVAPGRRSPGRYCLGRILEPARLFPPASIGHAGRKQ